MKALILVGGYGTRLRPLTLSVPKPLIQFCNRPMVEHQISALARAGVSTVVLAVAYHSDAMSAAISDLEKKHGVRIVCSKEEQPMGTAGPIRLAKHHLIDENVDEEDFIVLNSDVICDYPLTKMLDFHRKHGCEGTILTTKAADPSHFGVIVAEPNGLIKEFVEKPKNFVGDDINAGVYILKNRAIDRIELRPTSIETEIFPFMAADSQIFAMKLEGYWQDIGKPMDFLRGTRLYLDNLQRRPAPADCPVAAEDQLAESGEGYEVIGNVLIAKDAQIGSGCVIGPDVTIGPRCKIGDGVRVHSSSVMADVTIEGHSFLKETIVGWGSKLGRWTRVQGGVVGEDVKINEECAVHEALLLPHTRIATSILEKGKIVM